MASPRAKSAVSDCILSSGNAHKQQDVVGDDRHTNIHVVFDSDVLCPCENMTSSTKPEVDNTSHCHHTKTEPRPSVTCVGNFVKFGREIFWDIRSDIQTDTLITILPITTRNEVTKHGMEQFGMQQPCAATLCHLTGHFETKTKNASLPAPLWRALM